MVALTFPTARGGSYPMAALGLDIAKASRPRSPSVRSRWRSTVCSPTITDPTSACQDRVPHREDPRSLG